MAAEVWFFFFFVYLSYFAAYKFLIPCFMSLQEIAFFDITRTGELLSRLSEDTQIIKSAATTSLSEALRSLAAAFIGLSFTFATSWKLTCKHLIIETVVLELDLFHQESGRLILTNH